MSAYTYSNFFLNIWNWSDGCQRFPGSKLVHILLKTVGSVPFILQIVVHKILNPRECIGFHVLYHNFIDILKILFTFFFACTYAHTMYTITGIYVRVPHTIRYVCTYVCTPLLVSMCVYRIP